MNKIVLIKIAQRAMVIVGASLLVYSIYAPAPRIQVDFPMVNEFMTNGGLVDGKQVLFPFIVDMKSSKIIYDAPTLSVFHKGTWSLLEGQGDPVEIESGKKVSLMHWDIMVDTVYSSAMWYKDRYIQKEVPDGVPAAFLNVTDRKSGAVRTGWIYSGSSQFAPENINLGDSLALVLGKSKARSYWSDILIMRDPEPSEIDPSTMFMDQIPYIRVDSFILKKGDTHAIKDGWKIEMLGYEGIHSNQPDKIMMRVSNVPFEWKRYAGGLLLLLGALWLLAGRKKQA